MLKVGVPGLRTSSAFFCSETAMTFATVIVADSCCGPCRIRCWRLPGRRCPNSPGVWCRCCRLALPRDPLALVAYFHFGSRDIGIPQVSDNRRRANRRCWWPRSSVVRLRLRSCYWPCCSSINSATAISGSNMTVSWHHVKTPFGQHFFGLRRRCFATRSRRCRASLEVPL